MLLTELPRPNDRKAVPYLNAHLDTLEVVADVGILSVLSAGAGTSTKYREFPGSARTFLDGLSLSVELEGLKQTLDTALGYCPNEEPVTLLTRLIEEGGKLQADGLPEMVVPKASKLVRDHLAKSLPKWQKAPPSLEDAFKNLSNKDFFTVAQEIATYATETGLDGSVFNQVCQMPLADKEALLSLLTSAQPDKVGAKVPTKMPFREELLVPCYAGNPLHEHPVAQAWYSRGSAKQGSSGNTKACVICGEEKELPSTAQARIKGAVPGAGADPSMRDVVSWGRTGDGICKECWDGPLRESLSRIQGSIIPLRGTDVWVSAWDHAGDVDPAIEVLSAYVGKDVEDVREAVRRAVLKWPRGVKESFALSSDIRIQLWAKSNSTLNIFDYVSTSKTDFLDKAVAFGNMFPSIAFSSLVQVTAPSRFDTESKKWKIEPTLADWRRWLNRLLRGTPLTRTEIMHILQLRMSIFLRGLEDHSGWILSTQEHIMKQYVQVNTESPSFLLGKAVAIGSSIASAAGGDHKDKKRRGDGFRSTYTRVLLANPLKGFPQMRANITLWQAKAYQDDLDALNNTIALLSDIPAKLDAQEQCLFWVGMATGDKEISNRIKAATALKAAKANKSDQTTEAPAADDDDPDNPFG